MLLQKVISLLWKPLKSRSNDSVKRADVVELVDTPDLGSGAVRCESSSLSFRTISSSPELSYHNGVFALRTIVSRQIC